MFEENMPIIAVVLGILLLVSIVFIAVLVLKGKRDKIRAEEKAEERYQKGRQEVTDIMKMTMDQIQDDRKKLSAMPEKDIMIEAMVALGGYGRRLDRMEAMLQCLSNYTAYMEKMNEQVNSFLSGAAGLQNIIKETETSVDSIKSLLQEANDGVSTLNKSLADVGNIKQRTDTLVSEMNATVSVLKEMDGRLASIAGRLNETFDSYGSGPLAKMDEMISAVSGFEDTLSDIESTVDSIKSSTDSYSTWDLYYKMSDIESKISDVESKVDSSTSYGDSFYSHSDICSKIDELGSKIDSLNS